jgi:putative heme-binding domain-containing protein
MMFGSLVSLLVSSCAFADAPKLEPWADAKMPVTNGLVAWFDGSKMVEAYQAEKRPTLKEGDPVEVWPDATGHKRNILQSKTPSKPKYAPTGAFHAIRFDGRDDLLTADKLGLSMKDATVFIVAAPYSCPEWFSGFLGMSSEERNDYEVGLNIDQLVGAPQQFEVVNIEGAGTQGAKNLLKEKLPYGTVVRLSVTSAAGKDGIGLWMNGKLQGRRDRKADSVMQMDRLVVGGRFYSHGMAPQPRAFLDGDIAEVIIYDRVLNDSERGAVEKYLTAKYGSVPRMEPPTGQIAGKRLVRVENPPPVQVYVPGFTVRQLPIDLTNINNLLYRHDGKLVALGYDGNVWHLSDTDGDGVEDKASLFWDNKGRLRGAIGMALTPKGYKLGEGVFVAGKGKVSLVVDADADGKAEKEIVVADGWKELPHGVDALGVEVGKDGSVYFGLGCTNFTDAFLIDKNGKSHYDLKGERGTILKVAPDFKSRKIVATGIRFPVGIRFNKDGDLFCSDQEGATWLPNGNPFDELLHIEEGRHYGFPPRHPRHLPNVIDEPSTFDYGPQHQSTCGLFFNESVNGGPTFGPKAWAGDVFVAGYSRGKIYRTQLIKSPNGYIARNQIFACTSMLPADCCLAPDGSMLIACHSGGPDWGSGPTGKGKLYKVSYTDKEHPQPVFAWAAGPREVRVEFDRPVDPALLRDVIAKTEITAGEYVRAGDRFESQWPGYAVVSMQHRTPRHDIKVHSAQLTPDGRSLVFATDRLPAAVLYAVKLPGMGRPRETRKGTLPQQPWIDLDFDLSGAAATWTHEGKPVWTGWLPSLDLAVSREWTKGSAAHDQLWEEMKGIGGLTLQAQLDLFNMLRPAVQPGSTLDHTPPQEKVMLAVTSSGATECLFSGSGAVKFSDRERTKVSMEATPQRGMPIAATFHLKHVSPSEALTFSASYSTNEDSRSRALPLRRALLPWADVSAEMGKPTELTLPKELAGGSWSNGRKVFESDEAACAKCHAMHGRGGAIGPDLSNLLHRDYASVFRDIDRPSFAINPDHLTYTAALADGRTLTGVVKTLGSRVQIGDAKGVVTEVAKDEIEAMRPSSVSTMPEGLLKPLGAEKTRDLLTYLMAPPPSMPLDPSKPRPKPRTAADVNAALAGSPNPPEKTRPIRIVLVAGPKDHGPGEHDYPAWQKAWKELFSVADKVEIATAWEWPAKAEFEKADVMVFFQHGNWDAKRALDIDAFLERGGGLVYIHWAVDGQKGGAEFAKRIGLAGRGAVGFRHGDLDLEINKNANHPVLRNFDRLKLVDESYWKMAGSLPPDRVLATSKEDGKPQPQLWSLERGKGRVFVSIPGHYNWTFDDPLFRIILLRGIAWSAKEPVDRFNDLVWPGAHVAR